MVTIAPIPISVIDAGSGMGLPTIETEASEKNGLRIGAATPLTEKPAPPLTLVMFSDNAMLPGAMSVASEPPVTVPKVVLNNAPVPGGPIGQVNLLLDSV